jgi:uncharacterized protein YndB with AHSA1/START domain
MNAVARSSCCRPSGPGYRSADVVSITQREELTVDSTAEVSTVIRGSCKEVWNALTDPDLVREYFMGATVSTDWRVGSPITFSGEWKGGTYEDKGKILVAEPDEQLRFSHWSPSSGTEDAPKNYRVVDIALSDELGSTKVTLTQSNLEGGVTDADRASRDEYEKNWRTVLAGLKSVVEH